MDSGNYHIALRRGFRINGLVRSELHVGPRSAYLNDLSTHLSSLPSIIPNEPAQEWDTLDRSTFQTGTKQSLPSAK